MPLDSQIYPVFLILSQENIRRIGTPLAKLLRLTSEGHLEPKPEMVLDHRIFKKGHKASVEMLI